MVCQLSSFKPRITISLYNVCTSHISNQELWKSAAVKSFKSIDVALHNCTHPECAVFPHIVLWRLVAWCSRQLHQELQGSVSCHWLVLAVGLGSQSQKLWLSGAHREGCCSWNRITALLKNMCNTSTFRSACLHVPMGCWLWYWTLHHNDFCGLPVS